MSYADMITLLICFFVIMLSVLENKHSDNVSMQESLKEAFNGDRADVGKSISELQAQFEQMIEEKQLDQDMSVEEAENGITLELASTSFYKPGSAEFTAKAIPILKEINAILVNFDSEDYTVEISGHTDDVPIKTAQFPSNWELSAGRAARAVRFMIDEGQQKERMKAVGMADVVPKVDNLDEFGNPIPENREINRRIVIRIERRE